MKMGRGTGPWGRCSVAARALVTCELDQPLRVQTQIGLTEHFPSSSKLSAEGMGAMVCCLLESHTYRTRLIELFA
jgi:hypothetical protein